MIIALKEKIFVYILSVCPVHSSQVCKLSKPAGLRAYGCDIIISSYNWWLYLTIVNQSVCNLLLFISSKQWRGCSVLTPGLSLRCCFSCQLFLIAAHHFDKVGVFSCCKNDLDVELCLAIAIFLECFIELFSSAFALCDHTFNMSLQNGLVLVKNCRIPT